MRLLVPATVLAFLALVPLMAAHDERVAAAREQMFPSTRSRSVSVSSAHGYAAGRAAADQAVLAGPRSVGGGHP